ncbi:hypothetical protein BY996DRAFT_6588649 [Phakopsora pachyrhizi]|nr:hypothetical protein BY996DRAFT_6588649 [Phakopsora pachyrhizi]
MRKSLSLPGEDHGTIHEDDEQEENFDNQRKRKMIKDVGIGIGLLEKRSWPYNEPIQRSIVPHKEEEEEEDIKGGQKEEGERFRSSDSPILMRLNPRCSNCSNGGI